ncbi:hypothetical protein NLG97_g11285 [Lecanicillium saksenae]|uniref:Uncharacterized protein n=1 Tax=Lecanicillium saksenae TaxID=468837 RepID=A0ACC1QAU7_9HYPO|nr:hypothetical protein NLG97_g11285 [Lecanicillium saksenae]
MVSSAMPSTTSVRSGAESSSGRRAIHADEREGQADARAVNVAAVKEDLGGLLVKVELREGGFAEGVSPAQGEAKVFQVGHVPEPVVQGVNLVYRKTRSVLYQNIVERVHHKGGDIYRTVISQHRHINMQRFTSMPYRLQPFCARLGKFGIPAEPRVEVDGAASQGPQEAVEVTADEPLVQYVIFGRDVGKEQDNFFD